VVLPAALAALAPAYVYFLIAMVIGPVLVVGLATATVRVFGRTKTKY